jgi:hypothetical protein
MNEIKPTNVELITGIISVSLVLITAIGSFGYYNIQDRTLMASNIESAISKGVDPLSVRCSYVNGGDTVCVAYAASHGASSFSPSNKK